MTNAARASSHTTDLRSRRSATRSPEADANALGFTTRGRFVFCRSQRDFQKVYRDCIALPEASGQSEAGKAAKALHALCLDASARAAGRCDRARIGVFDETPMRNIDRTVHSGTGSKARPVRAALPLRMPRIGRRCFASGRKLRGRAAAQAVGHRFESGSSTTG